MSKFNPDECCPRFDPEPWSEKELQWKDRRFVKDRVTSRLYLTFNMDTTGYEP